MKDPGRRPGRPVGANWAVLACLALLMASTARAGGEGGVAVTRAVRTASGPVVGIRRGGLDWYLGIPYAAPPVGALRWRPPTAPPPWRKPREAGEFGNWCTQVAPEGFSKPVLNEDCLYLNVVTPRDASRSGKRKAVIVWIHGGGQRQGRSNDYDPTPLVDRDVVFVSFNYRLNIFGFLAHPDLDREGHDFADYGLMDQQFALRWVKRNIAAFGGDPRNVTLMGESSGGANVFNHLVSPSSTGLFGKAIVESGSLWFGKYAPFYDGLTLQEAEQTGQSAAGLLGCTGDNQAACLRAATTESLAAVVRRLPAYSFGVVVEGTLMAMRTSDAIRSGRFARVPLINGSNHDEWTWVEGLHEAAAGHPLAEDEMQARLSETFGADAGSLVAHYPPAAHGSSAGAAVASAVTDGLFVCPLLGVNEALARFTRVWAYEFHDTQAPYPFRTVSFPYGAAHTLEMRYLFKDYTGAVGDLKPLTPDQQLLSDAMAGYWTSFAKRGDPGTSGGLVWPPLGPGAAHYLDLVPPRPILAKAADIDTDHQCGALWNTME